MKKFNFDELLWLIVLLLLDLSLVYLVVTGKIELYIGKKMIKYIYINIVIFSILIILQIGNVFTTKSNNSIKTKLIPIVLALFLGVISINSQGTFKHMELNKDIIGNSEDTYLHNHTQDQVNIPTNETRKKENLSDSKSINEPIVINEDNAMLLEEIRLNSENYIGKQIEVHGFVCKEGYLNKNQFIIGRIVMTCCAADSKVVGIIGEWEDAEDLIENQWVYVKGTIGYSTINDDDGLSHRVPIVIVNKLEIER